MNYGFDLKESVVKTHTYLENNELISAFKNLTVLEETRNDALMRLGEPTNTNKAEIQVNYIEKEVFFKFESFFLFILACRG